MEATISMRIPFHQSAVNDRTCPFVSVYTQVISWKRFLDEVLRNSGASERERKRKRKGEREREKEKILRALSFSFDIWIWSDSTTNRRKGFSITFCSRVPFPSLPILFFFSRRLMFIGDRVFRTLRFTFPFPGNATHFSPNVQMIYFNWVIRENGCTGNIGKFWIVTELGWCWVR